MWVYLWLPRTCNLSHTRDYPAIGASLTFFFPQSWIQPNEAGWSDLEESSIPKTWRFVPVGLFCASFIALGQ